ncbi:MAG: TrmB family transcriptional regulator [Candidatus Hodarchaeota archaeon]
MDELEEVEELKENFGLNTYEARVYVALIKRGEMVPKQIGVEANIPLPRTYDTLRALEEKGFVISTPSKEGSSRLYRAVDPEIALNKRIKDFEEDYKALISKKKNSFDFLVKKLGEAFKTSSEVRLEEVFLIRRLENIIEKAWGMIKRARNEVILVGYATIELLNYEEWKLKEMFPIIHDRLKNKVSFKLLVPKLEEGQKMLIKTVTSGFKELFTVKISENTMLDFLIIDQKEILLGVPQPNIEEVFEGSVSALWFQNPLFADALKRNFQLLWKQANDLEI